MLCIFFFFFKQKTAYEMRISDWSSDVCSSDLPGCDFLQHRVGDRADQIGRSVNPIQLAQMTGNLSRAHAARVHRDDLVIETGEATLVFGDKLWIETDRKSTRLNYSH